jgi:hypothetical protein
MRITRTLIPVAASTLATMFFMAAPAFAQSIEIEDETNGGHCGMVTITAAHSVSGGCVLHGSSEDNTQTFQHTGVSEVITSSCVTELTAHGGPTGGYVSVNDTTIGTNPTSGCVVTPCDEAGGGSGHPELEWPISGLFEYGPGREALVATFCIRPFNLSEGSGNTVCTLMIDITTVAAHQQELTAVEDPCFENPTVELSGHWLGEETPTGDEVDVELHHIHYPTS